MTIEHYFYQDLPPSVIDKMPSKMKNHFEKLIKLLKIFFKHVNDKEKNHFLLLFDGESRIKGYMYYYYDENVSCELFDVYIANNSRCKKYATQLIETSIKNVIKDGKRKFTVKIGAKEKEAEGLVRLFQRLGENFCPPNEFSVWYKGVETKYP